jgi:NADP-dependent 3-hydroxy acid dehydrogenase YdfG
VTGAGGGFGGEIATQSASRGAVAIVADIDNGRVEQSAAAITAAGGKAKGVALDVRDREAFAGVINTVVSDYGRVDVLVNNAGIMPLGFLSDHAKAAQTWDRCIDIDLKGVLHGIYAVWDHMIRQGGGHIVNISSVYADAGVAGAAVYCGAKAAVATVSNALRVEAQGRIKVTTVRPSGMFGTNLGDAIGDFSALAPLSAHRAEAWQAHVTQYTEGTMKPELTDREDVQCWPLRPADAAAQVVHAIDQPLGVAVSELTIRATGEDYVY